MDSIEFLCDILKKICSWAFVKRNLIAASNSHLTVHTQMSGTGGTRNIGPIVICPSLLPLLYFFCRNVTVLWNTFGGRRWPRPPNWMCTFLSYDHSISFPWGQPERTDHLCAVACQILQASETRTMVLPVRS